MAVATDREVYVIDEVVHFGGFFQGETVGLKAHPRDDDSRVNDLTIDDHAWDNLKDKHYLTPRMSLWLRFSLGEVVEASVLGHPDREALRQAIKERIIDRDQSCPKPKLRAIAYNCKACDIWVAQEPLKTEHGYACMVCRAPLAG